MRLDTPVRSLANGFMSVRTPIVTGFTLRRRRGAPRR